MYICSSVIKISTFLGINVWVEVKTSHFYERSIVLQKRNKDYFGKPAEINPQLFLDAMIYFINAYNFSYINLTPNGYQTEETQII